MEKKYHVYGMGNALVDLEFEVHEPTLAKFGIEKGTMTLINAEQQVEILEELEGFKHLKAGGGSAANTMMTLARLGALPFYSCRVADDAFGEFYHEDLLKAGVHTNQYHCERPQGQTGRCIVMLTSDAERTMCTYLGITAEYSIHELVPHEIQRSDYLYIEGYLIASPSAREAMHAAKRIAREHNIKIAFSLSDTNMVHYFHDELVKLMDDKIDLLFCNQYEAIHFCDVETVEQAAEVLKRYARQFVITQGKDGATLFDGVSLLHSSACKVPVLDTLGAGDTFAGAFLYGLTHNYSFEDCGQIANLAAAKIVTKFGPRLTQEEADQVKAEISELGLMTQDNRAAA